MEMRKRLLSLVLVGFVAIGLAGCNAAQDAQRAAAVIAGLVNVVQADVPTLPAADQAIVAPWATLLAKLSGQLNTCVTSAGNGSKATFLACFNAFASGALSQTELASLKIVSAGSQSRVTTWAIVVITAVNVGIETFGGTAISAPASASAQVDPDELNVMVMRATLYAEARP